MARVSSSIQFDGSVMTLPGESLGGDSPSTTSNLRRRTTGTGEEDTPHIPLKNLPASEACLFAISGTPAATGMASQRCQSVRRVSLPVLLTMSIVGLILRLVELLCELIRPSGSFGLLQPTMLMAVVMLLYSLECLATHAVLQFSSKQFTDSLDGLVQFGNQFDGEVAELRRRPTRIALIGSLACILSVPIYYLLVLFVFDGERTRMIEELQAKMGVFGVAAIKAAKSLSFCGQATSWFGTTGFYFISVEHLGCAAVAFCNHVANKQIRLNGCLQANYRNLAALAADFDSQYSALAAASIVCCTVYVTLIMYAVVHVVGVDWVSWFEKIQLLLWLSMAIAKMFLVMWRAARLNDRLEDAIARMSDLKATDVQQIQFCIQLANERNVGISNWRMMLLERKTLLTMFGVLATYFVVLLQFNQSSACNCWCNGTQIV